MDSSVLDSQQLTPYLSPASALGGLTVLEVDSMVVRKLIQNSGNEAHTALDKKQLSGFEGKYRKIAEDMLEQFNSSKIKADTAYLDQNPQTKEIYISDLFGRFWKIDSNGKLIETAYCYHCRLEASLDEMKDIRNHKYDRSKEDDYKNCQKVMFDLWGWRI